MPVGIENFALGLVQGMNARKAEDRQNMLDQRQAEQDQMRRQEFDLQQQARQFDLSNARASAENAASDRKRTLAMQARSDAFNRHFNGAYALAQSGDADGAINALATGFNDPSFGLPYRAIPQTGPDGRLVKDKNGKYIVGYTDASGKTLRTDAWTLDEALSGFRGINDAASQYDKLRETQAKAAERAAEKKDREDALVMQYDLSDRNNARSAKRQAARDAARGLSGAGGSSKKPNDRLSSDGLMLISSNISTIDDDGNKTTRTVVDTAKLGRFQAWAKSKGTPPNDVALQLWIPIDDAESSANQAQPAPHKNPGYDYSEVE